MYMYRSLSFSSFFSSQESQRHIEMQSNSPCAACKVLRRRCVEKCILSPYFPPTDPIKFIVAHKVFGASNITKLLLEIPEDQREVAVDSLVYEANARLRDPVYGCSGVIYGLQNQIIQLQEELAKTQAEVSFLKIQNQNSYSKSHNPIIMAQQPYICSQQQQQNQTSFFPNEDAYVSLIADWEPELL